ncbi:MAG: hypothetical protein E7652_01365 [Ruminococcaceae bacterium]|nr:hypothetical protein [Oscillospiraceae bacterium]
MGFYKKYSICLACIIAVFFISSYILGCVLASGGIGGESEPKKTEDKRETKEAEAVVYEYVPEAKHVFDDEDAVYYDIAVSHEDQEYVFGVCRQYAVMPELVFALMDVGCDYVDGQISCDGDFGIMQINSINHQWLKEELKIEDILDFRQNVLCGVYMLSDYCEKYSDVSMIAMCYRYGEYAALSMRAEGIYETEYTIAVENAIKSLVSY